MSLEGFDSNCKIAFTVKDTINKILKEELYKELYNITEYNLDEICEKIAKRIDDEI